MWRAILGVVVGWLSMTFVVGAVFAVTMRAIGAEGVYRPGTYWTTSTFNAVVMVGSFFGALVGGWVCALVAESRKPVQVLAVIVLALGLVGGLWNMSKPDPAPPAGEPTFEEGRLRGKEPNWFAFTAPLVGAAGVLVGAGLVKRKSAGPPGP
ncbi:MAG: hypothetical protein L0Y44_13610 [Phycisphaerales bacterium]|nr:hypothetical protein [Phycisphaerales bacterium]MCI0631681.1 hypothetical protein [Phycisphaerales bacterium]MCI0677021.1 hypothetical protein [Phycisphaerales bacterium]